MKKARRLLLLPFLLLTSCDREAEGKVIYTSFYPLYDLTEKIVKDKYEVRNLTSAGGEPHDYEVTPRQVAGMEDSDLVFVNGLGLENWTSSLPSSLEEKVVVTSTGIETIEIEGVTDPHVWLSPKNALIEAENIYSSLIKVDPDNASFYQNNYEELKENLISLDNEYREVTSSFTQKVILVAHAAFGYLTEEYGLTQLYVSGLSPDQEPTSKQLEKLIEEVDTYGLTTIFYEENVSSSVAEKIASETGLKTDTLNPLESLSEEEIEAGEDYFSVMRENLEALKEACQDD